MKSAATIENTTDLPLEGVQGIVGWTLSELEVDRKDTLCVVMRTDHEWHLGHFWEGEVPARRGFKYLLQLMLPQEYPYANGPRYRNGPPHFIVLDWEEALVCITAHEGMHLRQTLGPEKTAPYTQIRRGKIVEVEGSRLIEVNAEWAEFVLLEIYRERRRK